MMLKNYDYVAYEWHPQSQSLHARDICRYLCLCCSLNLLKLMVTRTSYNYLLFTNKQIHPLVVITKIIIDLDFFVSPKFRSFSPDIAKFAIQSWIYPNFVISYQSTTKKVSNTETAHNSEMCLLQRMRCLKNFQLQPMLVIVYVNLFDSRFTFLFTWLTNITMRCSLSRIILFLNDKQQSSHKTILSMKF